MKQTVNKSDFIDQFRIMDRLENFSYEARGLLFDYLEEYEEATGEELELDVIAVCVDYSEDSPESIADNYSIDISECDDEHGDRNVCIDKAVMDYLNENTQVVGITASGIVYAVF